MTLGQPVYIELIFPNSHCKPGDFFGMVNKKKRLNVYLQRLDRNGVIARKNRALKQKIKLTGEPVQCY